MAHNWVQNGDLVIDIALIVFAATITGIAAFAIRTTIRRYKAIHERERKRQEVTSDANSEMAKAECISIEVKFSDGSRSFTTTAEQADAIWKWFMGAETMACIHGAKFMGIPFDQEEATDAKG